MPGIGAFKIEWHLGGDLKTLKCMLGTKHGANTLFPCIYCLHPKIPNIELGKAKPRAKVKAGKQAVAKIGRKDTVWMNRNLSCDKDKAPSRAEEDSSWNPILSIPLERFHVCSLHARLRILDKLMLLHTNYAWNMELDSRQE